MFKRLRVRFIALSMASLLLVLGVILGAANYLSYRHVVQNADEIVVIDEHGIRERGTHESLLAQKGLYAGFYQATLRD